jgi:predicted pyridoxine 5'-phosphate oxidase superfamily flavin-nucleotide-binding protein
VDRNRAADSYREWTETEQLAVTGSRQKQSSWQLKGVDRNRAADIYREWTETEQLAVTGSRQKQNSLQLQGNEKLAWNSYRWKGANRSKG